MALFPNVGQTIKSTVTGAKNNVQNHVKGTVEQARNTVNNTVRGTVQGVVGAGVRGANDAISSVMRGDVSGAVEHIMKIPGNAFGTVDKVLSDTFGITDGTLLTGPGSVVGGSGTQLPYNPLQGAIARGDPMLNFCWFAQPPVLESPLGTKSLGWNYVEEVTIPFRTKSVNSIHREGRMKHYASGYSLDNLRVNFYMDESNKSMEYLNAWDACTIMPTTRQNLATQGGLMGLPFKYKKDFVVYLMNPAKETLLAITYVGTWLESVDSLGLVSSSSGRLIANASFKVDDIIIDTFAIDKSVAEEIIKNPNPVQQIAGKIDDALQQVKAGVQNTIRSGVETISSYF